MKTTELFPLEVYPFALKYENLIFIIDIKIIYSSFQ